MTQATKTRFLNAVRRAMQNNALERLLAARLQSSAQTSIFRKFPANHYQYPKGSVRDVVRGGIRYSLDISDYMEWLVYFGFEEPGRRHLLALAQEGFVAIDVGTNIGEVLLKLARAVGPTGRVVGFEPDALSYRKCKQNISLNGLQNVVVHNFGLGDTDRESQLVVDTDRNRGGNRIRSERHVQEGGRVALIPLDRFVEDEKLSRLDLLKIDVEGYELRVLEGARSSLSRFRPKLFVEVDDTNLREQGDSAAHLVRFLESMSYRSVDDTGRQVSGGDSFKNRHFDIICTPTLS